MSYKRFVHPQLGQCTRESCKWLRFQRNSLSFQKVRSLTTKKFQGLADYQLQEGLETKQEPIQSFFNPSCCLYRKEMRCFPTAFLNLNKGFLLGLNGHRRSQLDHLLCLFVRSFSSSGRAVPPFGLLFDFTDERKRSSVLTKKDFPILLGIDLD